VARVRGERSGENVVSNNETYVGIGNIVVLVRTGQIPRDPFLRFRSTIKCVINNTEGCPRFDDSFACRTNNIIIIIIAKHVGADGERNRFQYKIIYYYNYYYLYGRVKRRGTRKIVSTRTFFPSAWITLGRRYY